LEAQTRLPAEQLTRMKAEPDGDLDVAIFLHEQAKQLYRRACVGAQEVALCDELHNT
jgi:hypothetical protein